MGKLNSKLYGRKEPNRLDWLLAWVFVFAAAAALWMMIGILTKDAAMYGALVFEDIVMSLGFVMDSTYLGYAVVIVILNTVLIYGSLILLVCGIITLIRKNKKERIPGLVASFCAAIFFAIYLAFVFEFIGGVGKGTISLAFPIVLILFLVCFAYYMVKGTYIALGNCRIEKRREPEPEYYDEVEDFVAQSAEEEEVKEEPQPEKEPEPEEEPEEEEEEPSEGEEEGEFGFDQLGKRRKRIPFENKIRRSTSDTRARYQMIVSELRKFDFNDRKSIPGETFSYKREKLIFITFSGNTLKVHFRLDPKEFEDSPIPIKDASEVKRFEEVPAFIKIKSDLAARRAIALGERVAEENSVPKK